MTDAIFHGSSEHRPHHRHLEQSRAQVIDLLSRQAVERELLSRSASHSQDVVAQLVDRQQQAALAQRLAGFHPADIAFVLESLDSDARKMAWQLVQSEQRGAVLLEISEAVLRTLVADMPPAEIVAAVRQLESDDIADLVASLPDEIARQVLAGLDRDDQDEVRSALAFPEGSVGAMMDMNFVSVREDAALEAVLRLLRRRKNDLPEENTDIIVVDRNNVLRGMLSLQQLLLNEPEREVAEVMTADPIFFYTDDQVKDVVVAFEKYDLLSAPVVNLHQRVVGRITVDAVLDEINERAQSEGLRQVGLSEEEDLFAPVVQSARNRWPWLGLNLVTAFVASRVIGGFEHTISQLVALAALMPIVASIGGNTGNQTLALMIRGLSMDQLGPVQLRKMFTKEFSVAALNGAIWGIALGLLTLLIYHDVALSLVIAAALLLNLLVAASAGVLIPLLLHRFGRDPVMGSSVILTAMTDSMGFFIFLGLASIFLV